MFPKMMIAILVFHFYINADNVINSVSNSEFQCTPDQSLKKEIIKYRPIVNAVFDIVVNGHLKGKIYKLIADFVDKFGSRFAGSNSLEQAILHLFNSIKKHYLKADRERVPGVPHWIRGNESAAMVSPRHYKMSILGLGGSVSTPPRGITAEVVVVRSLNEINHKIYEIKGKIVVWDVDYNELRERAAEEGTNGTIYNRFREVDVSEYGAVAVLIKSYTPMSLYTPHTGMLSYNNSLPKIPAACITVEDAKMLRRMADRGETIIIELHLSSEVEQSIPSYNIIVEIPGTEKLEEAVLLSGHLDSWDVGQGAIDDAAGAFVSWFSLVVLEELNSQPKRTIRAALWTATEVGNIGSNHYVDSHLRDLEQISLVLESDHGSFTPKGIRFWGSHNAACIIKEIVTMMPLKMDKFRFEKIKSEHSDTRAFTRNRVPAAEIITDNDKYNWYAHSHGDMMNVLNSDDLDKNLAMTTALSYIIADISILLPRS